MWSVVWQIQSKQVDSICVYTHYSETWVLNNIERTGGAPPFSGESSQNWNARNHGGPQHFYSWALL